MTYLRINYAARKENYSSILICLIVILLPLLAYSGETSEAVLEKTLKTVIANSPGVELNKSLVPLFPIGSRLLAVEKSDTIVTIDLSEEALPKEGDEFLFHLLQKTLINAASTADSSLREFHIRFADKSGVLRPSSYFFPREEIPAYSEDRAVPPFVSRFTYPGALTGKRIYLSAGHGWYYGDDGVWHTQRDDTNGLIEDFLTAAIMNYHILPLLEKTGAEAIDTRERDVNTEEFIIDNLDSGFSVEGEWGDGASAGGWNDVGSAPYRVSLVSQNGEKRAIFKPDISKSGWYSVYIWYVAGENRAEDVEHIVRHAQGETVFYVNQEANGSRWNHLGRFYFYPGGDNALIITNKSEESSDQYAIADAVKFGGGVGSVERGGKTSGKPRWQECCRYFAQFNGAPASVYDSSTSADNSDDVTCRPRFSEHLGGGDAFVSVHTNAFNSRITGTETFMHETGLPEGSERLRDKINAQLISDIRAEWDVDWTNRGTKTANFGELRLLSTMPGALTELAFHDGYDGVKDNEYLKNPWFRRICGRAVMRGILRYFDDNAPFPPPTVETLTLTNGDGGIVLNWKTVEGAEGYAIYLGKGGRGFAEPIRVAAPPYLIDKISPGETVYAAVAGYNKTGEGYLSKLIGAKRSPSYKSDYKMLVVDGFNRWDYSVDERVNTFDFSVEHIEAVPEGVTVDGATNTAVLSGQVALSDYPVVDMLLGLESTADETFSSEEIAMYSGYLFGGGAILITGAEIGWDLDNKGSASDKSFFNEMLKASYLADGCDCYRAEAVSGGAFDGIPAVDFSDGTVESYKVVYADELAPSSGGETALKYPDGNGAAIAYNGSDYKLILFGFPFETIVESETRKVVMKKALEFLIAYDESALNPSDDDDDTADDDDIISDDDDNDIADDDDVIADDDDAISDDDDITDDASQDDDDNDNNDDEIDGGVEDKGGGDEDDVIESGEWWVAQGKGGGGRSPISPDLAELDITEEPAGCSCKTR
ncbi:MAG: hypothetical protein Kow0090_19360 [Myxococcota bacterium]